jgi:peptidoglycan/LPS O-acetylase OafA/YrhL
MKRIPELDAVRGLASIGVVVFHVYPAQAFFAWSFVDLFFVLSGYLITTIIWENVDKPNFLRVFYFRRILRVWPIYYLTLAIVLAVNSQSRTGYRIDALGQHLTFTQNLQEYMGLEPAPFIAPFAPSWSLAVEEQFYLLWPLLIWFFGRRAATPLAVGTLMLGVAARYAGLPLNILLPRVDGIVFGCLLAIILANRDLVGRDGVRFRRAFRTGALALIPYLCVVSYFWMKAPGQALPWPTLTVFVFGLFYFCIVGLLVCYTGRPGLKVLRRPTLLFSGQISYAVYLFHAPIFIYLPKIMEMAGVRSRPIVVLAVWVAVLALPTVSYFCFEGPILRFKDRLTYGPTVKMEERTEKALGKWAAAEQVPE